MSSAASVKRRPVYCGCCSMNLTNAVRIRCAQLQPRPHNHDMAAAATPNANAASRFDAGASAASAGGSHEKSGSGSGGADAVPSASSHLHIHEEGTKKHEPLDSLTAGPRKDGMVPVCDEFDICGSCFTDGKEVGRHKRWHDYRVVTQHAYPIFTDDWGADEELLLISACQAFGLGNWADIAEHIGSYRTKEEVEAHYLATYIDSQEFPLPVADVKLVDQDTFQARKKQRLEEAQLRPVPIPPPKPLASAPTCHEIAGFMPGRLEFETEWENDCEGLIKDMEFGLVARYGGFHQPTREEAMAANNGAAQAAQMAETSAAAAAAGSERASQALAPSGRGIGAAGNDGAGGGPEEGSASAEGAASQNTAASAATTGAKGKDADGNDKSANDEEGKAAEETIPVWDEQDDDIELKLTIMEIYNERIQRRLEAKNVIFDRGLLEYKKLIAVEKKRPKEERDLLNRIKVFSRLQTALDHEEFSNGLLYEQMLRKQIKELQEYRACGITSFAEVDKYEKEKAGRIAARGAHNYRDAILLSRSALGRGTGNGSGTASNATSREGTPALGGKGASGLAGQALPGGATTATANAGSLSLSNARKQPVPQLTLANSASLQLLTPRETELCSELRILPKPFIFIKQGLLREFARCLGRLEKERAVELLPKIQRATVERVWELLFGQPEPEPELDEDEEDDSDDDDDDDNDSDGDGDDDDDLDEHDVDGEADDREREGDGEGDNEADRASDFDLSRDGDADTSAVAGARGPGTTDLAREASTQPGAASADTQATRGGAGSRSQQVEPPAAHMQRSAPAIAITEDNDLAEADSDSSSEGGNLMEELQEMMKQQRADAASGDSSDAADAMEE